MRRKINVTRAEELYKRLRNWRLVAEQMSLEDKTNYREYSVAQAVGLARKKQSQELMRG